MGGYGSGRSCETNRSSTVSDCRTLHAARWAREGILAPDLWQSGGWWWKDAETGEVRSSLSYEVRTTGPAPYVRLHYTITPTGEEIDYRVRLQTTRPHYGGVRWWFTCPALGCGRRCGVLYLPPGGNVYACRKCYRLAYASQRETLPDRRLRKANKIRGRLEGKAGMANRFPWKPKGMHWRTYWRLREEAEVAELQGWVAILGDMERRFSPVLDRMNRRAEKRNPMRGTVGL